MICHFSSMIIHHDMTSRQLFYHFIKKMDPIILKFIYSICQTHWQWGWHVQTCHAHFDFIFINCVYSPQSRLLVLPTVLCLPFSLNFGIINFYFVFIVVVLITPLYDNYNDNINHGIKLKNPQNSREIKWGHIHPLMTPWWLSLCGAICV